MQSVGSTHGYPRCSPSGNGQHRAWTERSAIGRGFCSIHHVGAIRESPLQSQDPTTRGALVVATTACCSGDVSDGRPRFIGAIGVQVSDLIVALGLMRRRRGRPGVRTRRT
jgi:hypothetical protein